MLHAPSRPRFYMPQLDTVRFFAFFLVYIHHFFIVFFPEDSPIPNLFEKLDFGILGVNLFFCLSAFLITFLLLAEISKTGDIALGKFYARRTLRIWPLYYFMLFFELAWIMGWGQKIGFDVYDPEIKAKVAEQLPAFFVFLGNFSVAHYGIPPSTRLSQLWTISVEEQFYLFWPLLLVFLIKYFRSNQGWHVGWRVCLGLFVFTVTCRILSVYLGFGRLAISKNTFCILDPFVMGILAAFWWHYKGGINVSTPWKILALTIIILGISTLARFKNPSVSTIIWEPAAQAVVGVLFILVSVSKSSAVLSKIFSFGPLVWLGKISYGLYVYHLLALRQMDKISMKFFAGLQEWPIVFFSLKFVLGLGLTILISAASYYFFEKHFLTLKDKLAVIKSRKV